mmetsp:Transcript_13517/g.42520  ORF Transcript_13517/g.42520 Transcript_13517/m.42520 type:complete len:294 (-) Transcript_13517:608-1489(-)
MNTSALRHAAWYTGSAQAWARKPPPPDHGQSEHCMRAAPERSRAPRAHLTSASLVEGVFGGRLPGELGRVAAQRGAGRVELEVLVDNLWRDGDDVLPLPVLDQVERLEGRDDVVRGDGGHHRDLLDGEVAAVVAQRLQQDLRPVGAEGEQPEVRERLLGRADFGLADRDLVGAVDEELGVALALVLREDEDARDVVVLARRLLLGEVARDPVAAVGANLAEHVKEEGVHVVVEGLVVEEELCEQAEALAVHLRVGAVDLEDGQLLRLLHARREALAPQRRRVAAVNELAGRLA